VAASPKPAAASPATDKADPQRIVHRVKRGDTLFGIAQLYDTTVAKIKSLNRLQSNRITPGTRLKIVSGN
jgi:LysM repeat protein